MAFRYLNGRILLPQSKSQQNAIKPPFCELFITEALAAERINHWRDTKHGDGLKPRERAQNRPVKAENR